MTRGKIIKEYDDKYGFLPFLLTILFCLLLSMAFYVGWSTSPEVQEKMNKRADFVAQCKSAGGTLGGESCYKDGVEILGGENGQVSN